MARAVVDGGSWRWGRRQEAWVGNREEACYNVVDVHSVVCDDDDDYMVDIVDAAVGGTGTVAVGSFQAPVAGAQHQLCWCWADRTRPVVTHKKRTADPEGGRRVADYVAAPFRIFLFLCI